MVEQHDIHSGLIDLDFQGIHLLIIGNDGIAPIFVAFEESLASAVDATASKAGHHEDILAKVLEGGFEVGEDVAGCFHRGEVLSVKN
jgi:hypothetical protein